MIRCFKKELLGYRWHFEPFADDNDDRYELAYCVTAEKLSPNEDDHIRTHYFLMKYKQVDGEFKWVPEMRERTDELPSTGVYYYPFIGMDYLYDDLNRLIEWELKEDRDNRLILPVFF